MILLICTLCQEAFSIHSDREKACECGKTYGMIVDGSAVVSPFALPVGISNGSILRGRRLRPQEGYGRVLDAMVLPHKPERFTILIEHRDLLTKAQQETKDE